MFHAFLLHLEYIATLTLKYHVANRSKTCMQRTLLTVFVLFPMCKVI